MWQNYGRTEFFPNEFNHSYRFLQTVNVEKMRRAPPHRNAPRPTQHSVSRPHQTQASGQRRRALDATRKRPSRTECHDGKGNGGGWAPKPRPSARGRPQTGHPEKRWDAPPEGAAIFSGTTRHRPARQRGTDELTNHSDRQMPRLDREVPETETNEASPPPLNHLHTRETGG